MTEPSITEAQYAELGRYVAATLGANPEWDSPADYLEWFAEKAGSAFGVSVGDQDAATLKFWRGIADRFGVYYEDNDELCRERGEFNDDGEGWDGYCGDCADKRTCSWCGESKDAEAQTCGDAECIEEAEVTA